MTNIPLRQTLLHRIRQVSSETFEPLALDIFNYQFQSNSLYAQYVNLLGKSPHDIQQLRDLPFLPIQFFKTKEIKTGKWVEKTVFTSSSTTRQTPSKHYVYDFNFYKENCVKGFEHFYGPPADYCWLALLPSYLERKGSSLIDMVQHFIEQSNYQESGFFLNNWDQLIAQLQECTAKKIPTVLLGVSFALLDLAEREQLDLQHIIIMETGGMKGKRKELTKAELHQTLKERFQVPTIHSEYGMTELFSQAYSKGEGRFYPAPTMQILAREITDPLHLLPSGKSGGVNIIDLGNLDTCSFIATDDLGKGYSDGSFEILGRLDDSDVRGCNLMVE